MMIPTYGVEVYVYPFLPIDETVRVCDVETKEEVSLLTGNKIHCIRMGKKIMVSQSLYNQIKDWDGDAILAHLSYQPS